MEQPIPHPLDDIVFGVIDAYRAATPQARQALLADLTSSHAAVLCAAAERLAALAVRTRSTSPLHQALVAVGMAVEALNDSRDHLYALVAVNHSATILNASYAALVQSVVAELPPTAVARLHAFDRRSARDRSLEAFYMRTEGEGDQFRYRYASWSERGL